MKHIIILMDGMGDHAIESLNNETPMMAAHMSGLNQLCKKSQVGYVQTIPEGMSASSDVANLGILGYSPEVYHKGRAPFEAINLGVNLKSDDLVLRCNLITLSEEENFLNKKIIDHSGGMINDSDGKLLMHDLNTYLQPPIGKCVINKGYKHLLLMKNTNDFDNKGPHEILNVPIKFYALDDLWMDYYEKANEFLNEHPINKTRVSKGLLAANGLWLWGAGQKSELESFDIINKKKSMVIGSVDLILGLAKCAKMKTTAVRSGDVMIKTEACISAIEQGYDFIYVHLEEADDASHEGNLQKKIEVLEDFDEDLVLPLLSFLKHQNEAFKLMILPDHLTPVELRRHTEEAVPYLIYNSTEKIDGPEMFNEFMEDVNNRDFDSGSELLKYFLGDI